MLGRLTGALVWHTFLVQFFCVGYTQRGAWPFLVIASVFALLGLIAWVRWAQMLGDLLRYGNSFLAYDEFPYFLGGTLRARLRAPRHLAAVNSLSLTLRCVQERRASGTGNNRRSQVPARTQRDYPRPQPPAISSARNSRRISPSRHKLTTARRHAAHLLANEARRSPRRRLPGHFLSRLQNVNHSRRPPHPKS
jgi:hypothetical protein